MSQNDDLITQLTEDLETDILEIQSKVINLSELEGENRAATRIEMLHAMNIVDPNSGKELDSNCINLSQTGILLYCFEGHFELDKVYQINIKSTEATPEFSVQAKLVRLTSEDNLGNQIVGLKMLELTSEQQNFINKLIG